MFHKTSARYSAAFLGLLLALGSCKKETTPKPNAYLALNYPTQEYKTYENSYHHFTFDLNKNATAKELKSTAFEIHYPEMKATIFMNYKTVDNNLDVLLKDAQKLTYEHFIKADEIIEQPFLNEKDRVFGMFYHVGGNAATNVQFYATDSVKNFVVASLYFYAKPNFDSILPASHYIQQDMRQMLESLKWEKAAIDN
ncbi:gliding motility lipoprotein GldD [Myroides sp. NP-2]|uniref:gliding motility lipoprotein GldD n=1 Tax=Myroides sp. NP-2 TaxID=2759945 RepID=UPI0015FB9384|nr:gliding motility lipoprotein GldD [Myroides sp. NP-2]MBB1148712.1 gliding motility lipoprotein GldD [Myroides sp. NP-2]